MSETTDRSLFSGVEAFEAAAFRAGQQARQFLTAHQGLPLPYSVHLHADAARKPLLMLITNSEDDVRSWADTLGIATADRLQPVQDPSGSYVSLRVQARTDVDGMDVWVSHGLELSPDEWEARQAAQGQADTGTAGGER